MMWIVRLALIRPYTFIVMSILIMLMGIVTITRMSTDIFPEIDIPVVSVIWTYNGISADEMAKRVVTVSERAFTTTVNDIEHIESQSYNGVSVIKVYFHPGARIEAAVAQMSSVTETVLRVMPPGIFPPLIIRYNASNVPILQLSLAGKGLSEQELYDLGLNFVRTQLATVQGAAIPLPLGGKPRQIMVDLDTQALLSHNLSASDVVNALTAQNVILPAGTAKMGTREYTIRLNSSPDVVSQLNDLPIRQVNGATVYIRDVGQVRDGFGIQTNIVRQDGKRSSLLTVLKASGASTLDVVNRINKALPDVLKTLPPQLKINKLFDQSVFVRASIDGVVREAIIAACLTAVMILIFLGSWQSTLIVAVSIPLSILCSIIGLSLCGQTLNVMTLGGLALAIGMLVDDATVEIENIHRNLGTNKSIQEVILIGAQQVATPALVSTLSICIVFIPVVFITGAAKSLFTPLALAVVFAMLASYVLSRTLVPVMAMYLIHEHHAEGYHEANNIQPGWFARFHQGFNQRFNKMRGVYQGDLAWALTHRGLMLGVFILFFLVSICLLPFIGQDFFPSVDAGQLRLHVITPPGTRIEETEHQFTRVEREVHRILGPDIKTIIDNIGLPNSGINLAFSDSVTIGPGDGEILVSLKPDHHHPSAFYMQRMRDVLNRKFPNLLFFFQPADIVSQILNFGLPCPIDIKIVGYKQDQTYKVAQGLLPYIKTIPGAVDAHIHQIVSDPELFISVDRTLAGQLGLTQQAVANNILVSLSSSSQGSPNYWLNPKNGVNYLVAVQTPQYNITSMQDLKHIPIYSTALSQPELLDNLAQIRRTVLAENVSHYNVQPTMDIYTNVQNRDLGGVGTDVDAAIAHFTRHLPHGKLPRGVKVTISGQVDSMRTSFVSLGFGLILAIVLVYLLMVVNFQSWLDPLIIMMATPAALSGVLWMLFITQTTLSVPSLMGAIMSIGVATANSILVVNFANDQRHEGLNEVEASLSAGFIRLRPVLMTALAMIIGMLPMSLGLGEGGEQNAPLGRAVIGGLLAATFATLFFVPILYSMMRKGMPHQLGEA